MGKLVPIVLLLLGAGAGVGAGVVLTPHDPAADANPCGVTENPHETRVATEPVQLQHDYVKMNNQFVVPVVKKGKIGGLVVMSITIEVAAGESEVVYQREPKLRDAFLRVMFDHANSGGFEGDFTSNGNLAPMRRALTEAARQVLGQAASDVLITDIGRQDN